LTGQYKLTLLLSYHSQTLLAYANLSQFFKMLGGPGKTLLANRNAAAHLSDPNTDLGCHHTHQSINSIISAGPRRPPVNPY
jgi:hypothetical protein